MPEIFQTGRVACRILNLSTASTEAEAETGLGVIEEHALDGDEMEAVIEEALDAMHSRGVTGKDTTPFLLTRIAERTGGRSLAANIELVINNARLAAKIACELRDA